MKLFIKMFLGTVAAMLFASSITVADTIRPTQPYDDDWEPRVLRFTADHSEGHSEL